jgi:type I restriction enzyme, S subunit
MMKDWKEIKLGEICTIKHGWAFKGEFFKSEGERIVVTPGNFFEEGGFRLQIGKEKFYSADFPKEYLLKKDDLIIAMTEQGEGLLGSPALVPRDYRYLHNQRIGLFQDLDENVVCKKFMYYIFFTKGVRGSIASSATGTKVKHTAPKRIYSIKINLPPLQTQQKIANILSGYDDLIENNLRRIKLLEEMAAITYKEWFVNFTIDGEKLAIDNETGLPFGWERKSLVEVANLTMGQSPDSKFYNEEGIGLPFHQGVTGYGFRFPTNKTWSSEGKRFAERGDILFSVRAPVGRINISLEKIILGRGLASIRHKKNWNSFLCCQLKYIFFKDDLMGGGSIFNSVTKKDIEAIMITEGDSKTMTNFNQIVTPIDKAIENLESQNRLLKESRDILLPRLMSGEVEV